MANLLLIGPQGAGKTTVVRRLAERLEVPFQDQDACFEASHGPIPTFLRTWGRNVFTIRNARVLRSLLQGRDGEVIATSPTAAFNPYVPATASRSLRWMAESGLLILLLPSPSLSECRRLVFERTRDRPTPPSARWIATLYGAEVIESYRRVADLTITTEGGVEAACDRISEALELEEDDDREDDEPARRGDATAGS